MARETPRVQAFVARHRAFFILVGVLVAQLLLLSLQITRGHNIRLIQLWAVAILDPFERSLGGIADAVAQAWATLRHLHQAQTQNQELRVQLVTAYSRIQQLSEQAAEADRLRTLLDFKNRLPFQTVAAEVILASPGENSNAVYIDKGTDVGVARSLAVITPAGAMGKIIEVDRRRAQVLLITDPASGVGCILERSRIQGVVKGAGRDICQVHYVMNEERVEIGETVLTSGLDQIYPKGLPIGTVLKTSDGNIYKNIVVKPTAALNRLETVLVILKPVVLEEQAFSLFPHR